MSLILDDLDFTQFSFELRFAHSYLVWDRAGRIWQDTARMIPNAIVENAAPNKIVMRDGPVDLTIEPNRVGVQIFNGDWLKRAPAIAADFTQMVASILELDEFIRIGLRMIYWQVFPSRAAAAEAVMKLGLLRIPEGRHFGVCGPPFNPEITIHEEEGGKGFSVRVKAESLQFKIEVPYVWQKVAKSVSEERQILSVDIDSYVQGTILSSQITFNDWITQTLHAIRRDAPAFFGG